MSGMNRQGEIRNQCDERSHEAESKQSEHTELFS